MLVKEHKDWVRRCLVLRQQVGARLEVLASLADKQIAIEDESSAKADDAQDTPMQPTTVAVKKPKAASAAQSRQPAQNKAKPTPAASATTTSARSAPMTSSDSSTSTSAPMATMTTAPIPSPTSFPEPPMPNPVAAQPFSACRHTGIQRWF